MKDQEKEGKAAELTLQLEGEPQAGTSSTLLVADEGGNPVAGVTVHVMVEGLFGDTDAEGRLSVEIPVGTVKLHFGVEKDSAKGQLEVRFGEDGSAETDPENDGISLEIEEQIQAGTTVTLLIADEQGAPVPDTGVRIKIERDAGLTSDEGLLDIEIPLYAEQLSLEAGLEDRRGELTFEFTVGDAQAPADGDGSDQEGEVGGTALTVQVEGRPQAGAEVTIVVRAADGSFVVGAEIRVNDEVVGTTGSDGELTITIPQKTEELEIKASVSGAEGELQLTIQ